MGVDLCDLSIRVAEPKDVGALAELRAAWGIDQPDDPGFQNEMASWIAAEGDRRTTWLATISRDAVGMASLFEYRRMPRPGRPDSRWGYVSNMFVRDEFRNRGIGAALLTAVISAADERGYVRLVLSPSQESVRFYERAGFTVPDHSIGDDRLLVRVARGLKSGSTGLE
jgi:GNAT superfamily N-acetyltransferase